MDTVIMKIENVIQELGLNNKLIVVAVSGGPDSVALMHILHKLGLNIHIAHLNHDLRGQESKDDAEFVEKIAQKLLLPYTIEKREIPQGKSVQQEARRVRYNFLKDVCKKNNTDTVMLAQHGDDQLETVMMNFFRGAGLTGLCGIKKKNYYDGMVLVRPLLDCTKEEIIYFLKQNGINYRIDSSNKKEKYLRNKFRLRIIPYLQKTLGLGFKEAILGNVQVMQMEDEYLQKEAKEILDRVQKGKDQFPKYDIILDSSLNNYHKAIMARIIRIAISRCYNIRKFTSKNIFDAIEVCLADEPKSIYLPDNVIISKWDNNIGFFRKNTFKVEKETAKIDLNEIVIFGDKELAIRDKKNGEPTHEFSGDGLQFPLRVRSRKAGDRIKISLGGTKKLKDYFIDKKIPKHERDYIPILSNNKDDVISIVGYRVSSDYYVNKNTTRKLYLYVNEIGGS